MLLSWMHCKYSNSTCPSHDVFDIHDFYQSCNRDLIRSSCCCPHKCVMCTNITMNTCRDPQDSIPFAEILYSNQVFTKALYNALEDDGLIIMQLGEAPFLEDPADESTKSIHRSSLIKQLENVGFESMHAYSEVRRSFLLVMVFFT